VEETENALAQARAECEGLRVAETSKSAEMMDWCVCVWLGLFVLVSVSVCVCLSVFYSLSGMCVADVRHCPGRCSTCRRNGLAMLMNEHMHVFALVMRECEELQHGSIAYETTLRAQMAADEAEASRMRAGMQEENVALHARIRHLNDKLEETKVAHATTWYYTTLYYTKH